MTTSKGQGAKRLATGLPAHLYAEGDLIRLKGSRDLFRINSLLDTPSGTGYMVTPEYGGAFKAVRDESVVERIRTAAEDAAEREQE